MFTSQYCLEKLETAANHEVLAWKLEYESALKREQEEVRVVSQYTELLNALHRNSFAIGNNYDTVIVDEPVVSSFELANEDEPVEIVTTIKNDETCESCEIVEKRRGRRKKKDTQ